MHLTTERNFIIPKRATRAERMKVSIFIAAFFIFVIVNFVFSIVDARCIISAKTRNEHYFDFPGLKKLCFDSRSADRPQAVLLGSSLFVHPLRMLDKKLGEQNGIKCLNLNCYHATEHLNRKLRQSKADFGDICSLAVGGAMISDDYLLLNKIASNGKFPEVVIVDCAPRSFYDSGVTWASSTPIFDYFFNERDFFTLGCSYLPSWSSKLEFLAKYYCPFGKHRKSLSDSINGYISGLIDYFGNNVPICSTSRATRHDSNDPLKEYRQHYRGISTAAIESQMHFLNLLVNLCAENKTRLLVLNMPLSDTNKSLLNPDFYSSYKEQARLAVKRGGGHFLDLDASGDYVSADFDDSVHLGLSGGEKLEDRFVTFIKGRELLATDFSTPN